MHGLVADIGVLPVPAALVVLAAMRLPVCGDDDGAGGCDGDDDGDYGNVSDDVDGGCGDLMVVIYVVRVVMWWRLWWRYGGEGIVFIIKNIQKTKQNNNNNNDVN